MEYFFITTSEWRYEKGNAWSLLGITWTNIFCFKFSFFGGELSDVTFKSGLLKWQIFRENIHEQVDLGYVL